MTFAWTPHRFSGGLLALDLVNTVVCRTKPERRIDRFAAAGNIPGFATAATALRASELAGATLVPPRGAAARRKLIALREAIDSFARPTAAARGRQPALCRLLKAIAAVAQPRSGARRDLAFACGLSALGLLAPEALARVKCCPNCDWLFIDGSRNRSRVWCDMAVCGNRAKAKAHYRRVRLARGPLSIVSEKEIAP